MVQEIPAAIGDRPQSPKTPTAAELPALDGEATAGSGSQPQFAVSKIVIAGVCHGSPLDLP